MPLLMRLTPICCSLLSVIAMCFSIWFVIGAFVEHRVKDLEIATFTDDFRAIKYDCDEKGINCKTVGTCMETVTSKQLEERGYHKYEDCTEDRAENLGRLASVSLHPLVYAWQNHHARNVSNKYALQFLIPTVAMPEAAWSNVYNQKTTASGTSLRFQDRLNTDDLPKVNALHFFHAVDTIPHSHVPAKDGCRATYPTGVFQPEYETRLLITYNGTRTKPHDKYDTQVPVFDITEQVQCGDPEASKNYLLKDPAEWTDATQPQPTLLFNNFADTSGVCASGATGKDTSTDSDLCFTQAEIDILYTHCTLQFRFLGAGASQTTTLMHDGTYGIPNVMTSPLKALSLPAALDGYYAGDGSGNDDYTTRVRLLLGTKFGDAAFAYTIILAVCAFLLADALLFLLSEVTWPERLLATYRQSAWIEARLRDLYKMRATNVLIRNERFTLSVLAAVLAFIVWGILLRGKWGDTGSRRPICVDAFSESIEEDEDHNGWYRLTSGGWQSDHDAANYENWAILLTWFSILALPIARYDSLIGPLFESALVEAGGIVQIGGNKKPVEKGVYANENRESSGGTWGAGLQEYALLGTVNLLAAGGIIVGVVGQALMAGTYGIAWAQSVIAYYARHKTAYETPKLYAALFDQCLATGAVAITTAWVAAAAINGLAVQGVGIPSLVMYFMWVLVTVFGFLPLLLYSDLLGDPFDEDSAKEDCKVSFWDASTETANGASRDPGWHADASLEGANCDTRYITYIIAVVLSGLAVLVVFVFLLFSTLRAMSQTRSLNQEAEADATEIKAARDSAKQVQLTNKGKFVASNAPADPASVVVNGFGVNGAPPAAQRRVASRLFHGVGAMGGVAGIGRASGRAVGQAVTAVVQQIDRPTHLESAYMTRSQTAQERHQEKLASLLRAPGAQALSNVPLQAVSRR